MVMPGTAFAAQAGVSVPLSFEGWTATGPGRVEGGTNGAIAIRYDSPNHGAVIVRPPQPVPLPAEAVNVRFWCARMEGDFDLRVLIRDAAGGEHAVDTLDSRPQFPAIRRSSMKEWSVWRQVESVHLVPSGRIEERVQPEFMKMARRLDWPRPLALAGIEIRPAKDRRDNEAHDDRDTIRAGRGLLWLAESDVGLVDGLHARCTWHLDGRWRWGWDTRPRLLLDDLSRRSGPMRYSIEVRKGYQGPVVWRMEGAGDLVRTHAPALLASRIELPELPAGRYFVETRAWTRGRELERGETMELFVVAGPDGPLPEPRVPLAWETGRPHHVFPAATTNARLVLRVDPAAWPARSAPARCVVRVTDWRGRAVGGGEHAKTEQVIVECAGLCEGTDYTATAEFRDGGKVLDRVSLHFGVASRAREAGALPPSLPGRDELLMSRRPAAVAELFGSALAAERGGPASDADLARMDRWMESLPGLGFTFGSFMFGWGECEPLPGVFRWEEIERRVALGGRLGVRMFLTPTLWGDAMEWPRWIEFQPALDQFGHVMTPGRSGVVEPAAADPIRRESTRHWLAAVATRFRANPDVIGYRVKPLNLHGDNRPQAVRPDFAPVTQRAFDAWTAAAGRTPMPMAGLFALPGQNPQRTGPDLSEGWRRFMEFRAHAYTGSVGEIVAAIRAVDPRRQIHIYRSSTPTACEAAIPLLADGAEFHDEGGPFYFQRAVESMCLQAGIPYTNEGHQFTPPSRAMADAGFFYGSTFDRGWSWLYRWNAVRHEDPRFAALPDVLAFVRDSQPALSEWVAAEGDEPEVLVFGSRADGLLDGMRTGFYADIGGLEEFTALFSYHQVRAHFADEHTGWADPGRFKCVFAVGDVMSERGIDRLAEFARKGGRIVRVGDAGRFCAERPAERDLLRTRLEGLPTARAIAAPAREPPPPGEAFHAPAAFDDAELDVVLRWAGAERSVRPLTPGFECVRKRATDGDAVYVAVFRRFPGSYENIWYDAEAGTRWGRGAARVEVCVPSDGPWRVERTHRTAQPVGTVPSRSGRVVFETPPAMAGELQIFRLTPVKGA
jgi:hypothetical protein